MRRDCPGPASQKGCLTVRSLLSYHMRRLANPDNLDTTLRPRRTGGRGPRCGPARVTPLGGGHRTATYGGRGVTGRTPIPADDASHGLEVGSGGGAGGEPGAAAPARAGAE